MAAARSKSLRVSVMSLADCDKQKGKNLRGVKVALLLLTSNGYERVLPLPFLALLSRPNSRTLVGADAPVRGVPERQGRRLESREPMNRTNVRELCYYLSKLI